RRILHVNELDIEDQVRFGRDLASTFLTVSQLIRNEQAPLAPDAHSFKTGVPTGNHAALALFEAEWLRAIARRIELGSVMKPAGVLDDINLARLSRRAVPDRNLDVAHRVLSDELPGRRRNRRREVVLAINTDGTEDGRGK